MIILVMCILSIVGVCVYGLWVIDQQNKREFELEKMRIERGAKNEIENLQE